MTPDPAIAYPSSPRRSLVIGERTVGEQFPIFIVAEIGTAHAGDLSKARELIDAAADSGADCAKFQIVFAEELVHRHVGNVELPGGSIGLFDAFTRVERDSSFYLKLKEHAEKRGMHYLFSAFGTRSVAVLRDIGADAIKIASPELNHVQLLREAARWGVPVILSTGVSTLADIESAIASLPQEKALLHCVTAYPAPPGDYNLRILPLLARLFGLPAGVSDHSTDPILVPATSLLCGGCIIEKHFTLSRSDDGLDDVMALPPNEFAGMVSYLRELESLQPAEVSQAIEDRLGAERVAEVLGDGRKKLPESERTNYLTTNRSIMAVQDIERGQVLTPENLSLLRSEKNLTPGLHPRYLDILLGRKVTRAVPSGRGIAWDDVLD